MINAIIISYLLGSIPSAYLIAGRKVMKKGDKNMGANNTLTTTKSLTKGLLVLFMDFCKAYVSIMISNWLTNDPLIAGLAAGACILGHNFSVFMKFKGGLGFACIFGLLTYLNPTFGLIYTALFITQIFVTRKYVKLKKLLLNINFFAVFFINFFYFKELIPLNIYYHLITGFKLLFYKPRN